MKPACEHNKKEKSGCAKSKPVASAGDCAFDGAQIALLPIIDVAHIIHGSIACAGGSWDNQSMRSSGPLPENQFCCGVGGVHMLTHPEAVEPLRNAKLAHFEQTQADSLLSANIGCALHLSTGLARNKVVHSAALLAELLL